MTGITQRRMRCPRSSLILALPLLILPALRARAAPPPPNVLLLVIDTLRTDRLGAYGNRDGLTPFLDSVAARGCVFRNAYAQSSWTLPSVASLLTSRLPSEHRVISFDTPLRDGEITLAAVLRRRGYATGGFSGNDLLSSARGFARGFDRFGPAGWGKARADSVTRQALSWLDGLSRDRPVFLYLHYMDPHPPYRPRAATIQRITARRRHARPATADDDVMVTDSRQWSRADPQALDRLRDLYDAEVADLDGDLSQLFSELQRRGFLENAAVIVTADHGEELMDHGRVGHGATLYDEVIHVPLIMLLPHVTRGTSRSGLVSLIDVAPTILDLAGAAAPASFHGHSLVPLVAPSRPSTEGPADSVVYSELIDAANSKIGRVHDRALRIGDHKLIERAKGGDEAYDLRTDPGEKNPHGLSRNDERALRSILAEMPRADTCALTAHARLDDLTRERTRLLGYGE